MSGSTLGLVCCSAGGLEKVRTQLIEPLLKEGWRVAVTATPTAADWLYSNGEAAVIEHLTGLPLRHTPRLPTQVSPHPEVSCYAVVPATANTVAKLALGIADNQALTQVGEAIGARRPPVIVFPRVNAAHVNHPAWESHIATLTRAGVHLIAGADVWPLHRPREAPADRELPWKVIREAIRRAVTPCAH